MTMARTAATTITRTLPKVHRLLTRRDFHPGSSSSSESKVSSSSTGSSGSTIFSFFTFFLGLAGSSGLVVSSGLAASLGLTDCLGLADCLGRGGRQLATTNSPSASGASVSCISDMVTVASSGASITMPSPSSEVRAVTVGPSPPLLGLLVGVPQFLQNLASSVSSAPQFIQYFMITLLLVLISVNSLRFLIAAAGHEAVSVGIDVDDDVAVFREVDPLSLLIAFV